MTSLEVAGSDRPVIGSVTINFAADSMGVDTPCNDMGGPVTYTTDRLEVGPLASTEMGCEPALMDQDRVIAEALASNPEWQLSDESLTLTGGGAVIIADSTEGDLGP